MRNILVKKNSYGKKKKREKIVIRSDKILLNELYEKDWLWMVFLKGGMIEKLMFCF